MRFFRRQAFRISTNSTNSRITPMDTLNKADRSERMSRIRSAHTKPEVEVRRVTHALGFRFRLHRRDLPGVPDLVFPRLKCIIFVHGCFWHQHSCSAGHIPKSRVSYWTTKLRGNVIRNANDISKLRRRGWRVLVVWECQTKDAKKLSKSLSRFLRRDY
jgi:DNA mismatch endonuclease (patch repair protein)